MNQSKEELVNPSVDIVSQKVQKLVVPNSIRSINLPKHKYEPFFMKIIKDFIEFHKLPDTIPPPQGNMLPHKLLSYIADLMAFSMGPKKRDDLIIELEEYKEGLPFDLR